MRRWVRWWSTRIGYCHAGGCCLAGTQEVGVLIGEVIVKNEILIIYDKYLKYLSFSADILDGLESKFTVV